MLGGWHGQDGTNLRGEFVEGEGVGGAEFGLPLGGAEDVPSLDGYPEEAGDVGGGEDAIGFEEFVEAFGTGGVGEDARFVVRLFELDPGEHFAADGFVADPEDEAAELLGLEDVWEGVEIGANLVDVHGVPPPPLLPACKSFIILGLRQDVSR